MSIEPMRRAWMEVDCRALRANYSAVAQRIPAGCRMLPMVKANAYGTGATLAVRTLGPLEPWALGVASLGEAVEARADGWGGRIVVFTPTIPADVPELAAACAEPVLSGPSAARACVESTRATGGRMAAHLEVDTGMGRFGVRWDEARSWARVIRDALADGPVQLASTFTHFHSAETDRAATEEQARRFDVALDGMRQAGLEPGLVHAANSAGVLEYSGVAADMVRPGIWLYGARVGGRRPASVATVRARVLDVRDVPAGTTVSYGATWTSPSEARLATLGIGYGDGLPRALSGRGRALIGGRSAPIRGVVTMDSTVIDVSGLDDVRPGNVATLLGSDGAQEITPEELADACGTIAYEILTGWSARVPRIGIDGDG